MDFSKLEIFNNDTYRSLPLEKRIAVANKYAEQEKLFDNEVFNNLQKETGEFELEYSDDQQVGFEDRGMTPQGQTKMKPIMVEDIEKKTAIRDKFLDMTVQPKDEEILGVSRVADTLFKVPGDIAGSITGDQVQIDRGFSRDWIGRKIKGISTGDYTMEAKDKQPQNFIDVEQTPQGQIRLEENKQTDYGYDVGQYYPYVALGFATGGVSGVNGAALDIGVQGLTSYLANKNKYGGEKDIAIDMTIDWVANGLGLGLAKYLKHRDLNKASQALFQKNHKDLNEEEIGIIDNLRNGVKDIDDNDLDLIQQRAAEMGKNVTPEKQASLDEATSMFDGMAREADPRPATINVDGQELPAQTLQVPDSWKVENDAIPTKEATKETEPINYEPQDIRENILFTEVVNRARNRSSKELQNPSIRVMNRTVVPEYKDGEGWVNTVNRELDVPNHNFGFQLSKADANQILKGNITPEIEAKIKNDIDLMESDPKWAADVEEIKNYGQSLFTTGGNTLGGALGGGAANEAAMIYEEDVQGKEISPEEKWARRAAAIGGGAFLGKKYGGGDKSTNMFVGAKYDDPGAFSNVYDDKIRRWIDDGTSKLKDTKQINQQNNEALKAKRDEIAMQYKSGEISRDDAVKQIEVLKTQARSKNGSGTYKLGEVLEHEELFAKYPALKDTEVSFTDMPKNARGAFDSKRNAFYISSKLGKDEAHSVLLHEIQHQIQKQEGWARGGGINEFSKSEDPYKDYRRLAGEQESRAVQAAFKNPGMEPYQALKKEEGVVDEPIVKMGGKSALSMDEGKRDIKKYPKTYADNVDDGFYSKLENELNGLTQRKGKPVNKITKHNLIKYLKKKGVSDEELESVIKESMEQPLKKPNKLGIETGEYNRLTGVWGNETNPVAQIGIKPELDAYGNLTPEFRSKIDDMAEMYAVAYRQDAVAWHHPIFKGTDEGIQNGIEFTLGKTITPEQALILSNKFGEDAAIVSTSKGVRLLNLGKMSNTEFHKMAEDIVKDFAKDVDITYFKADGGVVGGIKNGDKITKSSLSRRSDLQEWFDNNVAPQVERVNQRFTSIARENGYKAKGSNLRGGFATRQAISTTLGAGVGAATGAANSEDKLQGALVGAAIGAAAVHAIPAALRVGEKAAFGALDSVDWVVRGIQKAMLKGKTIDEAIGSLLKNKSDNHIIDTIKKAVVQDYRLSDQYIALADKASIAIKRGENEASKMFDLLKDLDESELTVLHNFIAGESKDIPDHLRTLAESGKRAIVAKTRELVRLGLLPDDILDVYKDGYLHREYHKHITKAITDMFFAQQKKLSKQYKRGKELLVTREEYNDLVSLGEVGSNIRDAKYVYEGEKNGKILVRRDWTAAERAEMGEVTNASYTVPRTILKLQRDIAYGKFLAEVATDPMLKDVVKTASEMKRIAGVRRIADIPDKINGFVRLRGKEYGKLNGMFVEEAAANDIKGFRESLYGDEREIAEAWKTLLTEWKVAKTIKNPTAHLNNFVSNMTMSYYVGVEPSQIGKNIAASIKEIRTKGAYFQEAEEIGLLGRSKLEEIRRVVDKPEHISRGWFQKIARNIYMAEDSKIGSFAYKMYSLEDDVARLSLYMHYRKKGKSIEEAAKLSGRVVFDYTKRMPPMIRGMRDTGLVPFISWTYKAIPLMFNTMFQRPSRYAALVGMYAILDSKMNDDAEKPEFMRGKYMTINSDNKESTQLRIQSMAPYFDWITEPAESVRQMLLGGVPQKAVEGLANREYWNDQKISYREGTEKLSDYGLWTFNSVLPTPSYLTKVYNVGEAVANDGKQVRRNKLFEPRSTAEAAAGLFGLNIRTYNKLEQSKRDEKKKRELLKKERKKEAAL